MRKTPLGKKSIERDIKSVRVIGAMGVVSGYKTVIGNIADQLSASITGRMVVTATVAPSTGIEAALTITANAYSDAGGSQWVAKFSRVETVAGESTLDELGGDYNALYHSQGFTLADWKGIETGGGFIDGVNSRVTQFTAIEANIPNCTNSGTVDIAAALRIASKATTGMGTVYPILQEIVNEISLFKGPINFQDVAIPIHGYRDAGGVTIMASTHYASAATGATFRAQFSRGTHASPSAVNANDLIANFMAYAYIDGDYRAAGALQFYVSGTPGAGSYPSDLYVRLVTDSATSVSTKAIFSEAGDLTLGGTKKTGGAGGLYAGVVAVKDGVTAPDAVSGMAVIYVDTSDGDLKCKFQNGFVATLAADS